MYNSKKMSKEINKFFGLVFSNLVFLPSVFAGVPKDNADHFLFGAGFSLGTTLCELTASRDISINRAIEFRDQYMSAWNKPDEKKDYQLVGTGLNLGITKILDNDSGFVECNQLILK